MPSPAPHPRPTPLDRAAGLLNEAVMGFLALVALATALAPLVFSLPAGTEAMFDVVEWGIIAVFAAEFAVGLAAARARGERLWTAWRVVDFLTIAAPMVSLLPQVSDALRSSPVLRLLRIGRAVAFGARAGGAVARRRGVREEAADAAPARAKVVRAGKPAEALPWDQFLQWLEKPAPEWVHVGSLPRAEFDAVARRAGVPRETLEWLLKDSAYPRAEDHGRFASLFLWLPSLRGASLEDVDRRPLLVLATEEAILSVSRGVQGLQDEVALRIAAGRLRDATFPAQVLHSLVQTALGAHESVVGAFEQEIRKLEDAPVPNKEAEFLTRSFRLKRELSAIEADLWRLKAMIAALVTGSAAHRGLWKETWLARAELQDRAEQIHEAARNAKENLVSLIELHMNVVSFEMSKFLKLLAIVSFLALFPSVIGGLLGMNVAGNPWPVTLGQVAFGVTMGMMGSLYLFAVKGWLK